MTATDVRPPGAHLPGAHPPDVRPADGRRPDLVSRAARIGAEVAAPVADEVDRDARFPSEAVDALRSEGLLGALIPVRLGGGGARVPDVARAVTALGRHCSSTSMIFAMHQIQVACLVRHGATPFFEEYLRRVAADGLLLASATTEIGVGGDVRTSRCAVERADGRFRLTKQAPVISYGQHADAVLATARRTPESPASDQVLVVCRPPGLSLEATSGWDTLGFRGTCSLGFGLVAEGEDDLVMSVPYADISSQTMLPVSHIVWGSVWLGVAGAAVERARRFVRAEARKQPGTTPPAAVHLAELMAAHQQMTELVEGSARRFDEMAADPDASAGMGFAIAMNALKVSASTMVIDIVGRAMAVCGMAAYRHDSPYSLGRLLRDAHGAPLMVNNDRILANNAQMLLVHRDRDDGL